MDMGQNWSDTALSEFYFLKILAIAIRLVELYERPVLKQHESYFGTRTTPDLALLSPGSRPTPAGWRLATACHLVRKGPHTVESGFQPGSL
ncbi:hypothetical protein AVEN_252617-1 [Araneus ventricosus]|uniref:Uncharacterized protein n=1 Tax=Araneus ventricosus TaxID=182803 RepID=A0A4Y2AS13_ARAVE|nr:hypothetical protein AVEN_252617-1 [Araneus ventricosus]